MSKDKRVTKLEKERRIFQVQSWLIEGVQDDLIIRQMKTQWDLSLRQAKRYLTAAYDGWKKNEEVNIEARRAAKIAELKQEKRSLKPEYKGTPAGINAIVRIEKLIIMLEDIAPARKHEIEANVNTVIKPTKYVDATNAGDRNSSTSSSD